MVLSFAIVSDSVKKTLGGIENHSYILYNLLYAHGYEVSMIDYRQLRTKKVRDFDIVIIEGIHRSKLLKILTMRKRNTIILFTHGSFYLNSPLRKGLRKYDLTKHQAFKLLFDKVLMKMILNKFDNIITLSGAESRDLSTLFGIEAGKLSDLEVFSDELDEQYPLAKNEPKFRYREYLCYVGRLDYRKNLTSLLEASRRLDIPLFIAGQDQGVLPELQMYCKVNNFNKFLYLGKISKEEKIMLMRNSLLIVIPSFFEGMPLTAVEGIKLGKNVVMTCNSYMGKHPCVHLSEPDPDSLVSAIKKSLNFGNCSAGFISNEEIFYRFINVVNRVLNKKLR